MDVDTVVGEIARLIEADLPRLTSEMTEWFVDVIPEFRHDDAVRRLMIASTSSNLVAIVDLLVHNIPADRVTVPPAAAEYARRFAQHDLSLEALLRAYRLGEHRFGLWTLDRVGRLALDTPVALAGIAEITKRTNRYIDRVVEGLIDIYQAERRSWDSRTGAARAAQLRIVLENDNIGARAAQDMIELDLDGWHQAAIVWVGVGTADPAPELQAVSRGLQELGGRPPTTALADDRTMWAWISGPACPRLDPAHLAGLLPLRSSARIGLGAAGHGLAGFRSSYREALRVRTIMEAGATCQDVVTFDDVAVTALLTDHTTELWPWVRRVLGGLADETDSAARLRETVRVVLQTGSYVEAAARLHLHKNSVHYRIRRAEEVRGRPLAEDRLDLEVAIIAMNLLAGSKPTG